MHPDDATGSVYRGSTVHISRPPLASVREDASLACIGKWRKSRSRYPREELLFYAQRRGSADVSAHGPFNICSVWHHLCAEASVRQRLCAQAPYQGMQFRTASGTDFLGEEIPARLYAIPAFPSIVFPAKLCLSLISHTYFCGDPIFNDNRSVYAYQNVKVRQDGPHGRPCRDNVCISKKCISMIVKRSVIILNKIYPRDNVIESVHLIEERAGCLRFRIKHRSLISAIGRVHEIEILTGIGQI